MEALRWILLLIGLALIGVIYWLGRRQGQDGPREGLVERARRAAREDQGRHGPAIDPVEPDLDIDDLDVHGLDVEERSGTAPPEPEHGDTAAAPAPGPDSRRERGAPVADTSEEDFEGPAVERVTKSVGPAPGPDRGAEPAETPARSQTGVPSADNDVRPVESESGRGPDHSFGGGNAIASGPDPEPENPSREARPATAPEEHDAEWTAVPEGPADDEPPVAPAEPPREQRGTRKRTPDKGSDERVVVLHVVAPEGERLVGAQLREVLESCGLRHGAYSIFHASDSEGSIVFSVANAVEPGTFDRTTMDTLTTPGIALFMQVPGAQSAETVFDRMLSTARAVADALEARVLDERHSTLTRQTEQHLREELRLLDRRTGSLQQ